MNKVLLYGNVGKDPESKVINNKTVTKFSLATNKTYTNAAGEQIKETSWHNIVLWGKVAEIASKHVKKGSSLIIEGEINYRTYENKEGQTIYMTEIIGDRMHFTGSKQDEKKTEEKKSETPKPGPHGFSDPSELPGNVANYDDIPEGDLPF